MNYSYFIPWNICICLESCVREKGNWTKIKKRDKREKKEKVWMGKRPRMAIWKEIKTEKGKGKGFVKLNTMKMQFCIAQWAATTVLYDCQGRELTGSPTHKPLDCYVLRRRQVTERRLQYILYRCMLHFWQVINHPQHIRGSREQFMH